MIFLFIIFNYFVHQFIIKD